MRDLKICSGCAWVGRLSGPTVLHCGQCDGVEFNDWETFVGLGLEGRPYREWQEKTTGVLFRCLDICRGCVGLKPWLDGNGVELYSCQQDCDTQRGVSGVSGVPAQGRMEEACRWGWLAVPKECLRWMEHIVLGQASSLLQSLPKLSKGEGTDSMGQASILPQGEAKDA